MANGEAVLSRQISPATRLTRRTVWRWAALFGLWCIPGFLAASQSYFFYGSKDEHTFLDVLTYTLPPWLYWAFVTPIILWLGRRFRLEAGNWPSSLAVHLIATIALGSGHILAVVASGYATGNSWYLKNPCTSVVAMVASKNMVIDSLIYWGVLAAAHAVVYQRRFRERELVAAQLQTQLVSSQMAALKMQLHPHFLFNTLHAIAVLVRKQDTQGSVRMITGLSDLLRMVLDSDAQQLVPLKQEMDFVGRYLDIERVRFADRLRVTVDIAHDTLDAQVPNLVLQPVVENAIRHGIASRSSAGELEIVARRRGADLVVTVRDDGAGVRPSSTPGLGLRNVRARLEQLYPGRHRLTLADDPRGGALATLEIPFVHG